MPVDNWPLTAVPTVTDHLLLRCKEESSLPGEGISLWGGGRDALKGGKRTDLRSKYEI